MCFKRQFSKQQALNALEKVKTKGRPWRKESRSYYCDSCGFWHLTSDAKTPDITIIKPQTLSFSKKWKKILKYGKA